MWKLCAMILSIGAAVGMSCAMASPSTPRGEAGVAQAGVAAGGVGQPLVAMSTTVQQISVENFQLDLMLPGAIARGDGQAGADLRLTVSRVEGEWVAGTGRATSYNTAQHIAEVVSSRVEGDALTAVIDVTMRPDAWVPSDGKAWTLRVETTLSLGPVRGNDRSGDEDDFRDKRFWTVFPRAQSSFRTASGRFVAAQPGGGEDAKASGEALGRMTPPLRPGKWNMGRWDESLGGVRFDFDMGTKRQNWNHARLGELVFEQPRDLSMHDGLEIAVATAQPRDDVEVTVWLQEADGSWYYHKSAAPLVQRLNRQTIRFANFAEAEWVSPTNHMDEDYVLDLTSIARIGVGVVNPLGVGEVSFAVQSIALTPGRSDERAPAQVRVTGETLSVNGHDMIPAGVFGGYAGHIPQRYRPGTQRHLYAPSYPIIPRQRFVQFGRASLTDWRKMYRMVRGEAEGFDAFGELMLGMVEDARARSRMKSRKLGEAPAANEQKRDDPPSELLDLLNRSLRRRDLFQSSGWPALAAGHDFQAAIARFAARLDSANDTEVMEFNRRLYEATFPKLVRAVDPAGPAEAYYINCLGERKEPAWLLQSSNWRERLASYGDALGRNANRAGYTPRWEFWNEPYLNWAERSRVNLNSKFFDQSNAREGGEVRVKYRDGSLGPVIPHFKWVSDGRGGLKVVDETAFSYWSGRGNGWIYDQMLAAVAPAIKQQCPEAIVIAGWGFRWNEDHWAAWDMLYKPTIDRNIDWIDALHEHHYQGDTTAMNGSYEVATAYGVTAHDRWLHTYNTETNDLVDAPARGAVDTPEKARAARQYRRMVYNLRDIVYCLLQSPDKFMGRTMIHQEQTPLATDVCFGLLRDLRGRLIETQSDDEAVWCVASIDGTDPQAMPPRWDGVHRLVVVVFNDHREPRDVSLSIEPPAGMRFAGPSVVQRTHVDMSDFSIARQMTEGVALKPEGGMFSLSMDVRSAWMISIPLKGDAPTPGVSLVRRSQFFSGDLLAQVGADTPMQTAIALPKAVLADASRAWLRLVVEDVAPGEGVVVVNGQRIALPEARTADNVNRIVELPVGVSDLRGANEIRFELADPAQAGYRVDMTSLVIEQRDEGRSAARADRP